MLSQLNTNPTDTDVSQKKLRSYRSHFQEDKFFQSKAAVFYYTFFVGLLKITLGHPSLPPWPD